MAELVVVSLISVGVTRVQLTSSISNVQQVFVTAHQSNTSTLSVGDKLVASNFYYARLDADQQSIIANESSTTAHGVDPRTIYVISDAASQNFHWGYLD